jgi:transposase
LFDLRGYEIERVEMERGWGTLFLKRVDRILKCPRCQLTSIWYHSRRLRRLRDLDIGRRHIELVVPVRQVWCSDCGLPEEKVSIARRYARSTRRLERHLFWLTGEMTVQATSELMEIDWEAVKDAEVRHIQALLPRRNLQGIRRLGMDEVSHRRGHKYLTLVTDLDHHRVIYVTENRDGKAVERFLRWFGPERCRKIIVVVTDMHDPYVAVIRKRLPKAALVYDHFHVSKVVHDALDEIRRRLQRGMAKEDREIIKNKRWILLRAREDLSAKQEVSLRELMETNAELSAGYILKEEFRWVFKAKTRTAGEKRLLKWEEKARESGIPELLEVLKTIGRRREGIMNYFEYQVANGMAEGFNNVVGTIKKQAYGFHDTEYLKLKILRKCGRLTCKELMK